MLCKMDFKRWLELRQYAQVTVYQYSLYENKFKGMYGDTPTQEAVDSFLYRRSARPARAFVKVFLEYLKIENIKVPQIKGRRKITTPFYLTDMEITNIQKS